jgi:2',3'-cyclic-nucleotide 2'-phosphodiesterase (5'-nucleotidase family)
MAPVPARSARARLRRLAALAIAGTLVLGAVAAPVSAARPTPKVDFWLTVLHNNDAESKLLAQTTADGPYAGVARFKTLVDKLKSSALTGRPMSSPYAKRGVVMLSSGDNFLAGAQWAASLAKGVPFYDSLAVNRIGYDAMAIGNHEFDFGPDVLADFIRGTKGFPFVSANLDVSGEPSLAALRKQGRLAASTVIRERGELIGIVGATSPQLPNISSPRNVVVDPDVVGAIQGEVDRLTKRGVNKIIVISHLQNIAEDQALAGMLRSVDVMIAGGGDELLANPTTPLAPGDTTPFGPYPLIATDKAGKSVPVVTTNGDFKYVGRLVVGFDKAGRVKLVDQKRSGPVRVMGFGPDAVMPDPTVQAEVVDPVQAFVDGLATNVLAQSEVPLNGKRGTVSGGVITDPGVRNSETNLGNLTADSMLWAAQQRAGDYGVDSPQVAMQNGGGIRNNNVIPAGPITELNTYEILAFTNFVSVKEDLTADQFKAVLETSVSDVGNGRFGQWAGVSFSYDPAAQRRVIDGTTCAVSDPGSRVQDVWVDGVQVFDDGTFVGPAGWTVDIATNDFTFRGGDCYDFGPGGFTTVGVVYQQALAEYLVAPGADGGLGGQITAAQYPVGGEGRIVALP